MDEMTGRVAVVTGAAQGQGAAEARLLAEQGCSVVLTDVKDDGAATGPTSPGRRRETRSSSGST